MGDSIDRLERDRALFDRNPAEQLFTVLKQGDTRLLTKAVAKMIEWQVATEEMARAAGVEVGEEDIAAFIDSHRDYIRDQTERAVTAFICSIVSQEG